METELEYSGDDKLLKKGINFSLIYKMQNQNYRKYLHFK
jgi:hypothetical protein